jgi:hypothetical protein
VPRFPADVLLVLIVGQSQRGVHPPSGVLLFCLRFQVCAALML